MAKTNVLVTYDVSSKQPAVKKEMKDLGYEDSWVANGPQPSKGTYYLPNTTLWKQAEGLTATQAKQDFIKAVEKINATLLQNQKVKIERLITVQFSIWDGIPGEVHQKNV
ncbi:hypothetical protein [Spirosoma oryzicola]|uniref:hypothetical protein n=1 Tax=Spirosoma oryzicola TaxID=2898794 RepID=UPI001E61B43D|nr:hypothetical protein [Spirosoma oryzicola]UHG93186.1 hypothetical protein LQ777_09865 [Spirosoma oryzicola]